ncbi:MAG: M48 family metalloprotease [Candidatus Eremiobacteraeota bacterium]|nr:M48 family metalloprotease [Candidatus Eremiobacteraeota bacterium]MBC5807986.1 M48 family metalloprotease [Candidatus Eremiobacteraeota bacterium]
MSVFVAFASSARAMSTSQERDWGRSVARDVIAQQGALGDPLLTDWVNRVGASLTPRVARTDIPYTFTVLDSEEVNAFSLPGGFIFIDAGLLNFVRSDDELAAVLGHEIGHVERRHVVTLNQKAKALEIVLDVAGLLAPGVGRFGNIAGNLALYKQARVDELQADQYGLLLIARAGYDPDGMVTFLDRLSAVSPHHRRLLGRYFETHPALGDRVAHVKGYAPLDAPRGDVSLSEGIADARRGEYFNAKAKIRQALLAQPSNALARMYDARLSAVFAQASTPQIAPPAVARLEPLLPNARREQRLVADLLKTAQADADQYEKYLNDVGYYLDPESRRGIVTGSRLDRILNGQARIARYLDHSFDQAAQTLGDANDVAAAGVRLAADIDRQAAIPSSAQARAIRLNALRSTLLSSQAKLKQAVNAARGAMAVGWDARAPVRGFLDAFDAVSDYKSGDMTAGDYLRLRSPLRSGLLAAKRAADAADVAAGLLNHARTDIIAARIDLFDPFASVPRRASLLALLSQRFAIPAEALNGPDVSTLSPAQLSAAAIISAASKTPLRAIALSLSGSGGDTIVQASDDASVRPETLQLQLGLVWAAYSDGAL